MSIEDDITFFEGVPTLRMLGRTALRILAIGAESRYVHDGEQLFKADDATDCGYVVQEGSFTLKAEQPSRTPEIVAGRIRAGLKFVPADKLVPAPDCGMKYMPRGLAFAKLKALADGAALVRSELS